MKTYLCRKTVTAARITHVNKPPRTQSDPLGRMELTLDDGSEVIASREKFDHAAPGDYYVREFDGQTSVQAATVFERWHELLVDTGSQVHPDSGLASRHPCDQALVRMETDRRERREQFDRMERLQVEKNSRIG